MQIEAANEIHQVNHLRKDYSMNGSPDIINKLQNNEFATIFNENGTFDYETIFNKINSNQVSGTVLGCFKSSYNKSLGLDAFKYTKIDPSIEIPDLRSNIYPVKLVEYTDGFKNDEIVALFPETFIGNIVKDSDPVFYFIDRFQSRFKTFTSKVLENLSSESRDFFSDLIQEKNTQTYFVNWVLLHEYFHRVGYLPIPEFLFEKSSRITAGFEELRADLLSLLHCSERLIEHDYLMTFKLILAERTYVYPIIRDIDSFDSLSSIVLHHHIVNCHCIAEISERLSTLLNRIESIELECTDIDCRIDRKKFLKNEFKRILDEATNSRRYFNELKRNII